MSEVQLAFAELKKYRAKLSRQQIRTLSGQIKSGQVLAAMKGLNKILERNEV